MSENCGGIRMVKKTKIAELPPMRVRTVDQIFIDIENLEKDVAELKQENKTLKKRVEALEDENRMQWSPQDE